MRAHWRRLRALERRLAPAVIASTFVFASSPVEGARRVSRLRQENSAFEGTLFVMICQGTAPNGPAGRGCAGAES